MPAYNTQQLLTKLYNQTESFLEKATNEWQNLPDEVFKYQIAPDKWSANQCLWHLNSYGRYYLPQIEKAIHRSLQAQPTAATAFTAGWLGDFFTRLMLTNADGIPAKKMSAPKNHTPTIQQDSHLVIGEFINQQEKLLGLLEEAALIDLNKIRVPISIAPFIRLKLGDTFLFLVAHNYRHVQQAERALTINAVAGKKLAHFEL